MANFEVERLHAPCVALHDRFKVRGNGTNYTMQYSHIYTERTKQMKEVLVKIAAERWPETPIAERVIDAEGTKNAHDWAIIGVVYKEMKLRSSVLDEFKGSGTGIISAVDATKTIWSEDDFLVLEDESGRVTLGGDALLAKHMVSGVVLAVRGCVDSAGVFQVADTITYDQSYANAPLSSQGEDQFLMIVSGLAMGRARSAEEMVASADTGEVELARQLLLDWLSGRAGGEAEAAMAAKVVRLIIAGDSIDVPELDRDAVAITYGPARTKLEKEHQTKSSNIIKRFDSYLALGLGTVPIDVMPGGTDPSVQIMPQQPLHPCLLPLSSRFSSLSLVTNPYDFRLGTPGRGCRIIGHSGQPLTDILSQADFNINPEGDVDKLGEVPSSARCIQALKKTLQWGHLAPTAPDTLSCYPLTDGDPFIIPSRNSRDSDPASGLENGNAPHVLFAGNQSCFASELVQTDKYRTLLVCVPVFSTSGTAVLVNLRTLEATTMCFQLDLSGAESAADGDMEL